MNEIIQLETFSTEGWPVIHTFKFLEGEGAITLHESELLIPYDPRVETLEDVTKKINAWGKANGHPLVASWVPP